MPLLPLFLMKLADVNLIVKTFLLTRSSRTEEAMAVSSLKAPGNENEAFFMNRDQKHEKRITPFSIDDILANSHDSKSSSLKDFERGEDLINTYLPLSNNDISNELSTKISTWNTASYIKWLDNFHRLCAVSTIQPFWFSDYCVRSKWYNNRFHSLQSWSQGCNDKKSELNQLNLFGVPTAPTEETKTDQKDIHKKISKNNLFQPTRAALRSRLPSRRSLERQFENGGDQKILFTNFESDDGPGLNHLDSARGDVAPDSPLSALEKLTCTTFKGMEEKQHELHTVAAGREVKTKRRKCRTAFTAAQLSFLEQRFNCHRYLNPRDRDQIAHVLGLSAPQVITWFQNRRAKLKRDLEEMKNDIKTVKKWTQFRPKSPSSPDANSRSDENLTEANCSMR